MSQLPLFGDPARDVDRINDFRCSECGRKGHNKRTCPDHPDETKPSIDQRFADFCQANPHVLAEMMRMAREKLAAGENRIGVKALWEELRSWLKVTGKGDYKLNNDFTAPAARKLIEMEPKLAGVIELRKRKDEPK